MMNFQYLFCAFFLMALLTMVVFFALDQQFAGCSGNWIEIAYGTSTGTVRIIVQHPETTYGQGPQLFQTFTVHCSPVVKVMISERHLVAGTCPVLC